jgi:hypothetical protein
VGNGCFKLNIIKPTPEAIFHGRRIGQVFQHNTSASNFNRMYVRSVTLHHRHDFIGITIDWLKNVLRAYRGIENEYAQKVKINAITTNGPGFEDALRKK